MAEKQNDFVKISRRIMNWGWYTDIPTKTLFLHCILRANWKPVTINGITLERGQFLTSLSVLSRETGLSVKQIRTALKHLIETQEVASSPNPKFTVITVNNYDRYQSKGKPTDKQRASSGQSKGKQRATDKKYKEYKEIKEEKEAAEPQVCPSGGEAVYDDVADYYTERERW